MNRSRNSAGVGMAGGAALAWTMDAWLHEAGLTHGGINVRLTESVPSSIVSSWPLVRAGARFAIAPGAIAPFAMLNTSVVRQRRAARAPEAGFR